MVRESAENRVYGLVNNLSKIKKSKMEKYEPYKIIVTGCMVGVALRDKSGKYLKKIKNAMSVVDEFMPIEEVGFDLLPVRKSEKRALVPISNGCNNFCTYCVVPYSRGREVSRTFEDILQEVEGLKDEGYSEIMLLGQNVNSYGADLVANQSADKSMKPVYVKHLGKHRIPTLFPQLLEQVAKLGFEEVSFLSSNPWDFSDELIDVIANNKNISRLLHLPIQSGDDEVLKKMNRWYTVAEYLALVDKILAKIPEMTFTTDIIVGFSGETEEQFKNTVALVKKMKFEKAYVAIYSERPLAVSTKIMEDNVPHSIKRERWKILDEIINKKNVLK
jgi:tRNA-2-methylthio-N6-dimethylallyladenosine synthase